jgi:hypothetical protein
LVAGIIVLVAQTKTSSYILLALIPACLFLCLDAYYLALEQSFRNSYTAFVAKLHEGTVELSDLYLVRSDNQVVGSRLLRRLSSTAIWPFYGALTITILLVWQFDWIRATLGF